MTENYEFSSILKKCHCGQSECTWQEYESTNTLESSLILRSNQNLECQNECCLPSYAARRDFIADEEW